jgi:hypothetical protein
MANSLTGPLTAFPNGVSSFGVPVMGSGDVPTTTGKYFFVASNAQGSVPGYYTSIANALAQCVSGRGDVIIVEPGYTETIGASGLTISTNGVSIVGLGNRGNRPSLTFAATAATVTISGSSVLLSNIATTCSIDEVVTAFTVTGASCTFDNVGYIDTATFQLIQFALVTGTRFVMQNCFHYQSTAAATAAYWVSLGGADRSEILNCNFHLTMPNSASSAIIGSVATAPLGIHIKGNDFYLAGGTTIASAVLLVASTTGMVTYNNAYISATSQTGTFALASAAGAQNFTTNVVNKSGILDPAADS